MKARIGGMAIGLAADCDSPAADVEQMMRDNLEGASTLPFVGVLTYEGKWVAGYSGFKQPAEMTAFLDSVEKSPLLQATPAVRKKLAGLAKKASAAAKAGKWGDVVKAVNAASSCFGRCAERNELAAADTQARAWVQEQFDAVLEAGRSGADLVPAKKRLLEVKRHFGREPQGELAASGVKALARLNFVRRVEKSGNARATLRQDEARKFAGSLWTQLFDKP